MTKNNEQIEKIYICNYGQTEFPVCVDLGHEYCKLDFQKSKECNLRAVVSYDDYLHKEQECEELKEINSALLEYRRHAVTCQDCYEDGLEDGKTSNKELRKLRKTLAEIKPILEFYANSKMGEEQPDRTYKIMLSNGYIMTYDPKPAREALSKINEVDNE